VSNFQIFSDGAADIKLEDIDSLGITTVPFYVSLDTVTYKKEIMELSLEEFYDALINKKIFPKTSLPSVSDYTDAFEKSLSDGKDIICFTITDTLSGSYQSAITAKQILEEKYPERNIFIVNSFQATGSQQLLVREAVKMKNAGFSAKEVFEKIEEIKNSAGIIFMVGGLTHLAKGGRIGRLASISGTILKIKPLIQLNNGYIDSAGIVRSRKAGLKKLVENTKTFFISTNRNPNDYVFTLGTTNTPEEIPALKELLLDAFPSAEFSPEYFQIGATISTHTGPDTIGICFAKKYNA
jgi:DegV family protein with EDD domain